MSVKLKKLAGFRAGLAIAVALFLGAAAGSIVTAKAQGTHPHASSAPRVVVAASPTVPNGAVSFNSGFAPVVAKVRSAVVSVSSTKVVKNPEANAPFFSDPFFRQFFGNQFPQNNIPDEQKEHGLGSGVIVSPDGYILTNNHVVAQADDIKVTLSDKRELKARVIGTDPNTDIAVLKVDAQNLPTVTLGDSSKVQVGNFVLAIGNPFGLTQTVTEGIISATGRGGLGIEDYEDFIQTDAPINPGNSGGALVDVHGDLVGINTAILTGDGSRGNQGVGFAIPVNMARRVMDQIMKNGRVIRGYLGAWIQPVTPQIAKAFNLKNNYGVLLGDVDPEGPAGKSGLERGDVVLAMNGKKISDDASFRLKVAMTAPGTDVTLKIFRKGVTKDYVVKLGELKGKTQAKEGSKGASGSVLEGLSVETLTPQIAQNIGLPADTYGVVIDSVQPGSAAADAGLQRGDVIQEINHMKVANMADFDKASGMANQNSILLLVNRNGNTMYVVLGGE